MTDVAPIILRTAPIMMKADTIMIDAEPFIIRTDAVITTAEPIMIGLCAHEIEGEPIISDRKPLVDAPKHNYIRRDDVLPSLNTIMSDARSFIIGLVAFRPAF